MIQFCDAYRVRNTRQYGILTPNEETIANINANYYEEKQSEADDSEIMKKDIHNVFLKMTFNENHPKALVHMIKCNYPISYHSAKLFWRGVAEVFSKKEADFQKFQLSLSRNDKIIYEYTIKKKLTDLRKNCQISIQLLDGCFYVRDPKKTTINQK